VRKGILVAALAALAVAAPASASTRQDVRIASTDGTELAGTLFLPSTKAPAAGWPAVVLLHGFGGDRASMARLAQLGGLVGERYAVLGFDARGHGQSGGLIGFDGPAEVADTRAVFRWLAARPDVRDNRIGAFGISYGGGAVLNSLAAGVPWAAVEVAETWSDLGSALLPQGLARSGVLASLLAGLPAAKLDPSVGQVRDWAVAGTNLAAVRSWAAQRSSLARLRGKRTPVFLMQGRRDFAFGLDQAKRVYATLKGPKRLWIGNHGHAPSSFPAADTPGMLLQGVSWFDRWLRGVRNGIERRPPVMLANDGRATTRSFARVPPTGSIVYQGSVGATVEPDNSAVIRNPKLPKAIEVFGAPTVKVTADARGGWSRLVAQMTARTPGGAAIVVGTGGVPTLPGARTYTIRLNDQATKVPKGSTIEVTLATSNQAYVEVPQPPAARLAVEGVTVTVPTLG
jgi:ABC-2 type transport system ATP-binding protein